MKKTLTDPLKSKRRGKRGLRAVCFASAGSIFLHAAAFPVYWGVGSLFLFGVPSEYETLGSTMAFTLLLSLAVFCLSTQFYLSGKQ